jgi:hypothetical protein
MQKAKSPAVQPMYLIWIVVDFKLNDSSMRRFKNADI